MAKPSSPGMGRSQAGVMVTAGRVSGRCADRAVKQVALLLDGTVLGSTSVSSGRRYALDLPPQLLGGVLDVVAVQTGRSLLPAPVALESWRGLRWGGVAVAAGRFTGSFVLDGPAAPGPEATIPVELLDGSRLLGRAFADLGEDGYRFDGPLCTLPSAGETITAAVRVGGILVPDAIRFGAAECGVLGCVDTAGSMVVQGWAVDLAQPGRRLDVELRVDGRIRQVAAADRLREDVQAQGLGDGHCGFELQLPSDLAPDRPHTIEVMLAGTPTHVGQSPYVHPLAPQFLGFFDALEGPFAAGWLVNMHAPGKKLVVEAVCEGAVIGSGLADLYRADVQTAGLPTAQCGFRVLLDPPLTSLLGRDIHVRVAGTTEMLRGSPRRLTENANITRFLSRGAALAPRTRDRMARHATYRTRALPVSIIMPVFNTPQDWLVQALTSVRGQWSSNWELICIDDGSTLPHVRAVLDAFARCDPRIRVLRPARNGGIARAVNFGLRAARAPYVAFMDHDDTIEPDAIYRLAGAALRTGADMVYSDEALTTGDIDSLIEVRARPAFSHDYYLSHPYFVHMTCVRTALARQVGGWDETLPVSADVDFVLRVVEQARGIAHVPGVLYRWRTHGGSAGHARQAEVSAATQAALTRHLARLGQAATVSEGLGTNSYRIDWPEAEGEVLVVIPTKNRVDLLRACIDSLERTAQGAALRIVVIDHQSTDPKTVRYLARIARRHTVMPYEGPFNYARMNNLAVARHGGEARFVLFLNNDTEAREPGWVQRLCSLTARPEVGAVGPLLLYRDDRVQHGGVLMGFSGAADHAMKFAKAYLSTGQRNPGYNCNLTSVRDYSAVTAACMMVRREVFDRVSGFDERFAVGFNDTDLCLRVREAGLKVLYDGFTVLYHHESATRNESRGHPEDDARLRERWAQYFRAGDPFYSPVLAPAGADHVLRSDSGGKGQMTVRMVDAWTSPTPS